MLGIHLSNSTNQKQSRNYNWELGLSEVSKVLTLHAKFKGMQNNQ